MTDRHGGRPRPRVHSKMNTETKRHPAKAAYNRKPKYRDDPLEGLELDDPLEWEEEAESDPPEASDDDDIEPRPD